MLYSLLRARPSMMFLIGGPGCGKTALMKDMVAMATEGTAFRNGVMQQAQPNVVYPDAAAEENVKLMTHRASLRFHIGWPAETITQAMSFFKRDIGAGDGAGGYPMTIAQKVARHAFHALEEVQAWVTLLPQFFERWKSARKDVHPHETVSDMLAACPHVAAMDPLQSSCKVVGVRAVRANGGVTFEERDVVMPWERIAALTCPPGANMMWHICFVHDQHRIKGALFRLLRDGYETFNATCIMFSCEGGACQLHMLM